MQINIKRVMKNLHKTGDIGKTTEGGMTRPGFSPEYYQAREVLKSMMEDAGLTVSYDRVGNVYGCKKGLNHIPSIMIGSHLDTVTNGGLYDGNLGIISALEVINMLKEEKITTSHPIEVVAFNAEEGSEMGGTFGSRVMSGRQNLNEIGLIERLSHYDLTSDDLKCSIRNMGEIGAFVELHIEQGAYLAENGYDIGIVDGIVGITRYQIKITGESNHAGTTPMALRCDSVSMAGIFIQKINDLAAEYGHPFVATIGDIKVNPGMYNVIPSDVTLFLEVRDLEQDKITDFINCLEEFSKGFKKYQFDFQLHVNKPSVKLSQSVIDTLQFVCKDNSNVKSVVMSSGAGHDAKELIYKVPTGMIFVPSEGGISHSPKEFTTEAQIAKGVEVLYHTVLELDKQQL